MTRYPIAMLATAAITSSAALAQAVGAPETYPTYDPPASVRAGYTAEDLIGADVRGTAGKKIGNVKDLIIGPDGQLSRLVVSVDEGWFGIGGRPLAVRLSDISVQKSGVNDVDYITVPVSKENVEQYGIFKDRPKAIEGKPREWRANELLGDRVDLKDYQAYGTVTDLMFDKQGKLRAISAAPELRGSVLSIYSSFHSDGWEPGDANYVIPYTRSELAKVLPEKQADSERQADADSKNRN